MPSFFLVNLNILYCQLKSPVYNFLLHRSDFSYLAYIWYANTQYAPLPQTLTRVTGLDGAKSYQMAPNSVVQLFDSNEDIMYIKSTDGAGFPTIKSFAFTEITEKTTPQTNTEDFVSRKEFESFKKELMNNAKQSISTESANTNGKRKQSNAVN